MRKNKKQKKSFVMTLCLLLIVVLGIGYAVLSQQLSINGGLEYGTMKWDVGFKTATDGGGTVNSNPAIADDKKSITITCDIGTSTASETCIANAVIANNSTFDVQLDANPAITYDSQYIESVKTIWSEDSKEIAKSNVIESNSSKEIQISIVTIELTSENLPSTPISIPITITMNWVEKESSNTNGNAPKPIFATFSSDLEEIGFDSLTQVLSGYEPFAYLDAELFTNKTLTSIGIPIKSVAAIDDNQTFSIHVVDKEPIAAKTTTTIRRTYEVSPAKEDYGTTSTEINKMVYFDLTKYNITVAEDETLAFGASTDTIKWLYSSKLTENTKKPIYGFLGKITNTKVVNSYDSNLLFDIYTIGNEATTENTVQLKTVLKDKNLSILGDSISTYTGYSNDATNTNSTIGSNAIYYKGTNIISDVNKTWWMQTTNQTGMNVLVNNSWSGDTIANRGKTRATQLHDDTGDNSGTNPDIIAVYIGINDIKNGGTVEAFTTNYNTMISNIKTSYPNADIFVFTHVPYKYNSATVPTITDAALEEFNAVIRNIANQTSGCYVVDLYANSGITSSTYTQYMGDEGLHPNAEGMQLISNTFVNKLKEVYLN